MKEKRYSLLQNIMWKCVVILAIIFLLPQIGMKEENKTNKNDTHETENIRRVEMDGRIISYPTGIYDYEIE